MNRQPFLQTRAGRLSLLGMMVLDVFVVPLALTLDWVPHRVGDVVFAGTMLVAMFAMGRGRGRWVVMAVALAAFAIQFARFVEGGPFLVIADAVLSAVALGVFAVLVLIDVFRAGAAPDRLIDVILAYLLVGATYAFLFEAVNVAAPGSLVMKDQPVGVFDYAYFSFTTLTSVGFGDPLPMRPVCRALAMAEALTGQLYVAVLIARFASSTVRRDTASE